MTCVSLQENVASNWGWGWRLLAAVWTNRFTEEHHHTSDICLWRGGSWEITQFVESQLRRYILPKLWELFVSVFPSPLEFTQWLLCRIWKTRRNQGCELDLKRYLRYMFTTTKTCHLQLLQKCGAGTTGPVSVKSYLEVTLISTWQIFSLSWRRGLSAWGWSQHIYFG